MAETVTSIRLNIAEVPLNIQAPASVSCTEQFEPFLSCGSNDGWSVVAEQVEKLPLINGKAVYATPELRVHVSVDGRTEWLFLDRLNNGAPYATGITDADKRIVHVSFLESAKDYLSDTGNLFFHIGWEKILCEEHRLVLHSACVDTPNGGILFSGESGIGKSTQADLWCRYGEAELLNGDRAILGYSGEHWKAYGSPYAGSSKCYRNASCEIGAIVMLRQSPECLIKRLDEAEAFRRIYANTTIHIWDIAFVNRICDLISSLVKAVPVYELKCTPDERAVRILQKALGEMQYE